MTLDELARCCVDKASKRRRVLEVLMEQEAWSDVVREFAMYGDIDFIPTEEYRWDDAERAMSDAMFVLHHARRLLGMS